jgi:hypothetical protein
MKAKFVDQMAQKFFNHLKTNSSQDLIDEGAKEEISLPNIAITGTKKCGTYAILEFLIAHPKIQDEDDK